MHATRLATALGLCFLLQGGLAAAVAAAPARSHATGDKDDAAGLLVRLHAAGRRLADGNDAQALADLDAAVADARFDRLPAEARRGALSLLAWNTYQAGDADRARALYARATALDGGDPDSWYQLALLELNERRHDAAARDMIVLAERWPEVLSRVDEDYIHMIRRGLDPAAPERAAFVQALFDANWSSATLTGDAAWYDLAVARLQQGKPEAAAAPLKRIAAPELLVWVRSDRRFDSLIDRDAWAFNVVQAARNQVEALRQQAQLRPDDLDVRVQLASVLLLSGEHAQVVALADEVDRAVAAAPAGTPAFTDLDGLGWMRNQRAIAYRRLGRLDDAVAELQRARQMEEAGGNNVSQALNLGDFQCRLGHADAAREAIAKLGQMSGYGEMVLNAVRLCIGLHDQDARTRDAALAFLRAHRKDGPLVYLEGLLRAGDLDAAAVALRDALAEPARRGEALEWVQDYERGAPLPGDLALLERRRQLLARADVRAAIDGVGRVERYPLYLVGEM